MARRRGVVVVGLEGGVDVVVMVFVAESWPPLLPSFAGQTRGMHREGLPPWLRHCRTQRWIRCRPLWQLVGERKRLKGREDAGLLNLSRRLGQEA